MHIIVEIDVHNMCLLIFVVLCMAVDDAIRGAAGSVGNSVQCFSASLEKVWHITYLRMHVPLHLHL